MKRFELKEKFYSFKALLKMAGGRDASPKSPFPGSASAQTYGTGCNVLTTELTSQCTVRIRNVSQKFAHSQTLFLVVKHNHNNTVFFRM